MEERPPPGWYPDPDPRRDGSVRFWGGDRWLPPPGWYPDPAEPGGLRYWLGDQWSHQRRHPTRGRDVRWALACDAAALVGAIWGGVVMVASDYWSGKPGPNASGACGPNGPTAPFPPIFPAWLLIAVAAGVALYLWLQRGRGDRRMVASALGCGLLAFVTFPLWVVVLGGMNCSL